MTIHDFEAAGSQWLASRQRILQRHKRKIAIRLEEDFWTQLEDCAREDNRKLSEVVFDVLDSEPQIQNRTAILRVFCIRWLRRRLVQARQTAATLDLQTVLSVCPTPCVVVTAEKAILAYNSAFTREVISKLTSGAADKSNAPLTFRVSTPLETVRGELLAGNTRYVDVNSTFVRRDKSVNARTRFCLLTSDRSAPMPPLCCFVVTSRS